MRIENIQNFQKYNLSFKKFSNAKFIRSEEKREKFLERHGIFPPYSTTIAGFERDRYVRAIDLLNKGVDISCIKDVSALEKAKYKQALQLVKDGFFDNFLYQVASLEKATFIKATNYRKKGLNNDCLKLFSELDDKQMKIAIDIIGTMLLPPIVAGKLAKLSEEQRRIALELLDKAEIDVACKISILDEAKQEECRGYIELGINPNYVIEISELSAEQKKKLPEILELDIGDINITDFAQMNNEEYARAKELALLGVMPNAIYDIILIENGEGENEDYSKFRSMGYSYSVSASLSAFNDRELKALKTLIEKHPEIQDLLKDEYIVQIIQRQSDDKNEVILTKNLRTEDRKTKITLVQTFNEYGDKSKSRLETYSDNSTSSTMRNQTGVFKAKYDKFGQIRELTELIQDSKTQEVTGIIHSKASELLTGVFESVYYPISDIKEGGNITPDVNFEDCVKTAGEPITSVIQNEDGSITYTEDFQINQYGIDRTYTEKRGENKELIYSSYSYQITDEEKESTIMDISRVFKKNANGTTTNIINGIEYTLHFDEQNHRIKVSDGKRTKVLDFSKKLPIFSENIIWTVIKQLPVDALITLNNNIKKLHHGEESSSLADNNNNILSTGRNTHILQHETGHIQIDRNKSILTNKDLLQTYGEEMDNFSINMPYNEQEFIQYFSPRADIEEADGLEEFIAETNVLLSTYGINYKEFNTRSQFLAKYFPRSIAKVAELLGKTSRKSLLR